MDRKTKASMLDPFFSTKFSGRGMGMAAVVSVARSHGAAIEIKSQPNQGTTVRVYFPVASIQPPAQRDERAQSIVAGQGTILVVDDDPHVRKANRQILEMAGYSVVFASCGREAIERFRDRGDSIDAVLLDYSMPDLDGIETLEQLREIRPDVVVLLQSGFLEPSALRRIDEMPTTDFVQKPYTASELTAKLRSVIADPGRDENSAIRSN